MSKLAGLISRWMTHADSRKFMAVRICDGGERRGDGCKQLTHALPVGAALTWYMMCCTWRGVRFWLLLVILCRSVSTCSARRARRCVGPGPETPAQNAVATGPVLAHAALAPLTKHHEHLVEIVQRVCCYNVQQLHDVGRSTAAL